MSSRLGLVLLTLTFSAGNLCPAQTQDDLLPRTLYYRVKPRPAAKPSPKRQSSPGASQRAAGDQDARVRNGGHPDIHEIALTPVSHMGFRYDIVLVENGSGPVDSTKALRTGQCFVLDVEANYAGYLYVLSKSPNGNWEPLFPSIDTPDESNMLEARKPVRMPREHCFEVKDPPEDEHLFLVLSRNLTGIRDLDEAVRGKSGSPPVQRPGYQAGGILSAEARVDDQVAKLEQALKGRELGVKRISKPLSTAEPANSVYVVDVSDKPNDRIMKEVTLRHE